MPVFNSITCVKTETKQSAAFAPDYAARPVCMCKFIINCPNCDANVNYTDNILCDILTRGLTDDEIQLDLLADKKNRIRHWRKSSSLSRERWKKVCRSIISNPGR